jgi:hypothetical protein
VRALLGAHAVSRERLYAVSRISGVIGVLWAIPSGLFLHLGGAARLSRPSWQPLLEFASNTTLDTVPVEQCYRVVGGVLTIGGVCGVLGLAFTWRWLSLLSAAICMTWCAIVAGFLGMSNVNVDDGGNFLSLSAALNCATFLLRFMLLVGAPEPSRAVQIYERG